MLENIKIEELVNKFIPIKNIYALFEAIESLNYSSEVSEALYLVVVNKQKNEFYVPRESLEKANEVLSNFGYNQ